MRKQQFSLFSLTEQRLRQNTQLWSMHTAGGKGKKMEKREGEIFALQVAGWRERGNGAAALEEHIFWVREGKSPNLSQEILI